MEDIVKVAAPPTRAALSYPLATLLVVAGALFALMLIDAAMAAWSPSKRGLFERARAVVDRLFTRGAAATEAQS